MIRSGPCSAQFAPKNVNMHIINVGNSQLRYLSNYFMMVINIIENNAYLHNTEPCPSHFMSWAGIIPKYCALRFGESIMILNPVRFNLNSPLAIWGVVCLILDVLILKQFFLHNSLAPQNAKS